MMQLQFLLFGFLIGVMSCTNSIKHDEVLAGKRAVAFAEVAFVRQDVQRAYALLSDRTKGYVPLEKFRETLLRLHPSGHPTSVAATEYEPMPGEKAMYIYINGKNSAEPFEYTLTMDGTAATDYKVSRIARGSSSSYLPTTSGRKRFADPIQP